MGQPPRMNERGKPVCHEFNPLKLLEAATGFEPVNNGFADRCLSHLAMPPFKTGAGNGT